MDVSSAVSLARKLMNENALYNWQIELTRAKTVAGRCKYGPKVLQFSTEYIKVNSEASVRNIIVHEIAHALVGAGADHNIVWQRCHKRLGGNGSQYYTPIDSVMVPKRFSGACDCDHKFSAHRLTENKHNSMCRICKKKIVWTDTTTGEIVKRQGDYSIRYEGFCNCLGSEKRLPFKTNRLTPRCKNGTCVKCGTKVTWIDNRTKSFVRSA